MEMSRYSLAMAIAGTMTLLVASLLVWLVVTEPVALATALNEHDLTELAYAMAARWQPVSEPLPSTSSG